VFENIVSDVLPVTIGIILLLLIGALVSLTVIIPLVRRLSQRNLIARIAVIAVVVVVSFAISFVFFSWLNAQVAYIFSMVGIPPGDQVEDPLAAEVVRELWVRTMVPPSFQQSCYSTIVDVCQRADWASGNVVSSNWGTYLASKGIYLLSSLAGGSFAWIFSRKR
jgi:predicted PurR-regulated permease PerM